MIERASGAARPDMTIVRVFDAPLHLVWKAWTEPQHLAQWFGPKGFTNPVCEVDPRPGGTLRITMQSPDGTLYPMVAVFNEVVELERLVWTTSVEHEGNVSFDIRQVTTFADRDGKTELTLQAFVLRSTPESADALGGMEIGWSMSLDKLEVLVARA
ncbi:MAG: activator of ATPase [Candidatus Eremiobacteraeota bacterium]|nr:activator of ATPase [Candidatus Eremiobacteraeota bacterium]